MTIFFYSNLGIQIDSNEVYKPILECQPLLKKPRSTMNITTQEWIHPLNCPHLSTYVQKQMKVIPSIHLLVATGNSYPPSHKRRIREEIPLQLSIERGINRFLPLIRTGFTTMLYGFDVLATTLLLGRTYRCD